MRLVDLTEEQKVQHEAVLQTAEHCIEIVKREIEALNCASYDDLLEDFDSAQAEIEQKRAILSSRQV